MKISWFVCCVPGRTAEFYDPLRGPSGVGWRFLDRRTRGCSSPPSLATAWQAARPPALWQAFSLRTTANKPNHEKNSSFTFHQTRTYWPRYHFSGRRHTRFHKRSGCRSASRCGQIGIVQSCNYECECQRASQRKFYRSAVEHVRRIRLAPCGH